MVRPPMWLLMHGFSGRAASFRGVLGHLAPEISARPIDLPGHGEHPAPGSLEDAMTRVVNEFPAEPVDLLGYSMGGRLALHIALAHPTRVRRLILVSANPGIDDRDRQGRKRWDQHYLDLLRNDGMEAFAAAWEALPLLQAPEAAPEDREHRAALRRSHAPEALAQTLETLSVAALPSLWPRLGDLPCPSLWVAGERDEKYIEIVERAASLSPNASHRIVPGAGHALLVEAPAAVAALLD